jgi:outer membrane lipopolysaccharide assembly protein LptE/RlpB
VTLWIHRRLGNQAKRGDWSLGGRGTESINGRGVKPYPTGVEFPAAGNGSATASSSLGGRGRSTSPESKAPSRASCRFLLSAFCIISSACGYHVAGRGDRLPTDVQTIAVPIFVNQTSRFKIEQRLTSAVTQELIERTKFRVTAEPSQADAVLKGTVKDLRAGVVTFDLNTGRATTLQIQVTASIELLDRHTNKAILRDPNYVFREEYQVSQNSATLFEEDQPALDRLSHDLARTLVTEILENF